MKADIRWNNVCVRVCWKPQFLICLFVLSQVFFILMHSCLFFSHFFHQKPETKHSLFLKILEKNRRHNLLFLYCETKDYSGGERAIWLYWYSGSTKHIGPGGYNRTNPTNLGTAWSTNNSLYKKRKVSIFLFTRISGPYRPFEILAATEGFLDMLIWWLASLAKYS